MFRNRGWGRPRPWEWRRRPSFGGSLIGGLIGGAVSELGANLVDDAMGNNEPPPAAPAPVSVAPAAPIVVNVTVAANTPAPAANTQ